MKISVLLTFLLTFTFVVLAQSDTYNQDLLSKKGQQAFTRLLHTTCFSLGGVGAGGQRSKSETSLIGLLKESDKIKALIYLTTNANTEGSLYALLGLKFVSKENYDKQLPLVKALPVPDQAIYQIGCEVALVKRSDLLAGIESGTFDSRFAFWERDINKP